MKNLVLAIAFLSLLFDSCLFAQVNNCLDFDGTNDYINLDLNNNLDNKSAFTIEMWANVTIFNGGQTFFALYDDQDH
jgi:hypothetical protein